jgi:hypothetical protein
VKKITHDLNPRGIGRGLHWIFYKTEMKIWAVGCGLGWIVKPLVKTVLVRNLQDLQDHKVQFLLERKNGEIQHCQIKLSLLIQVKVRSFLNQIIDQVLKYGFCKKSLRTNETLTS